MILVCAAIDFRKYLKFRKSVFFLKNHKKSNESKMSSVFSSRLDRFVITCLQFDKNCTQMAYFVKKNDFCIFEPKNSELIQNSSIKPLNCSPLKCTYLGKKSFKYHERLSQKKRKWKGAT